MRPLRRLDPLLVCLLLFVLALPLLDLSLSILASSSPSPPPPSPSSPPNYTLALHLSSSLRGSDLRLMPWSASPHTSSLQPSLCPQVLSVFVPLLPECEGREAVAVMDLVTLCCVDSPSFRSDVSAVSGFHSAVSSALGRPGEGAGVRAAAAHVVYNVVFNDVKNRFGLVGAGAVAGLADVARNSSGRESHVGRMWAFAALQNLAASYCDWGPDGDGRCYWVWEPGEGGGWELRVGRDSGAVVSDGEGARRAMFGDKDLMDEAVCLACKGPTLEEPYVGSTAVRGRDDEDPSIVTWSALGFVKNMALHPPAREYLLSKGIKACLCKYAGAEDWLEQNKVGGAMHHLGMDEAECDAERGEL